MSVQEASQLFELILGGFGALSIGAVAAILLWLTGVRSIPLLIGCAIIVAILVKFVIGPFLGFGL